MPAEKLFWDQPYRTELTANVTTVAGSTVTLDRTIFYAFSGGQEADAGTIDGRPVLEASWRGTEIYYTIQGTPDLTPGTAVITRIDGERRDRLVRLHFAAEIVLELVYQLFGRPLKIGAHIAEDKARVDFLWPGRISDVFAVVLPEAQRIIGEDLRIVSAFSDRSTERRYWQIEGFARVACGGIHPRTTGEVGAISLRRENIGKGKERIEIRLARRSGADPSHALVIYPPGYVCYIAHAERPAKDSQEASMSTKISDQELSELSQGELRRLVEALEEELEDVQMERSMTLGGTGVHIGAKEAERMRNEFDRDEARIETKLEQARRHLDEVTE